MRCTGAAKPDSLKLGINRRCPVMANVMPQELPGNGFTFQLDFGNDIARSLDIGDRR